MPNNKPGSRLVKAAGGVAWRPGPDGEPEILLVDEVLASSGETRHQPRTHRRNNGKESENQ